MYIDTIDSSSSSSSRCRCSSSRYDLLHTITMSLYSYH